MCAVLDASRFPALCRIYAMWMARIVCGEDCTRVRSFSPFADTPCKEAAEAAVPWALLMPGHEELQPMMHVCVQSAGLRVLVQHATISVSEAEWHSINSPQHNLMPSQ